MGFVCVLCRGVLTVEAGNEKLLSTICGHLFHEKCFLNYMDRKQTSRCPACFKLFNQENSSLYIYPVEHEIIEDQDDFVDDEIITDIIVVLREENEELKKKLSNLIAMAEIIGMGYENAPQINSIGANFVYSPINSKSSDTTASLSPVLKQAETKMKNNTETVTTQKEEYTLSLPLSSCSSDSSQSGYDSLITSDKNGNGLNDYYRKLIKTNTMVESLKVKESQPPPYLQETLQSNKLISNMNRVSDINNKTYRSTRREFLTCRNRTTSWLKKMTSKAQKLLSETIVSDVKSIMQQIAEIKFFMNSLETQGGIVERLSQTAKSLVSFNQVAPLEKNLTERCAREIERDFCDVHLKTSDRCVTLEIALIRCTEIESFVEESNNLIKDVGNRLDKLEKKKCETEHDVKMSQHTIISLLHMMESHKTNINDVKISVNDFRNCENSQMLPLTESAIQNIYSKYSSIMNKLMEKKNTVGNSLFCRIMKSRREPVFV